MKKLFEIEIDSTDQANLTTCNMIREIFIKSNWNNINIKELKESSFTSSNSSYSPYILTEIDNIIRIFHEKYPENVLVKHDETYQINLNNKLLYIIRDLLIRIEKLEKK